METEVAASMAKVAASIEKLVDSEENAQKIKSLEHQLAVMAAQQADIMKLLQDHIAK